MMHVWVPHIEKKQQYPLILFSHGLGDTYNGMTYTTLCKNIASQGYVVTSVSHSYACKPIWLSDGTQTPYLFPSQAIHFQGKKHMFNIETDMWSADMICALNECARYNVSEDNLLYNTVDMSRVGIIGHSLGGSTAIQVCRRDIRVLAAINLDGPLYGTDANIPFDKPMMFILGSSVLPGQTTSHGLVPNHSSFYWRQYFNSIWLPSLNKFIASLRQDIVRRIIIDGIVHDTFSDYVFTPDSAIQPWLIDGAMAHDMIIILICDFLRCYIK
jgi:dienelactone hydrolase